MKKHSPAFTVVFTVFFFLFAAFMAWYIPSVSSVFSEIDAKEKKIGLYIGKAEKQQYEYDIATEKLPLVLSELEEKTPLSEEALKSLEELRTRKKELEAERDQLLEDRTDRNVQESGNAAVPASNNSVEEASDDE